MDISDLFEVRLANGDRFFLKHEGADAILGSPVGTAAIPNAFKSVQAFDAPLGAQPATASGFVWINPMLVSTVLRLSTTKRS